MTQAYSNPERATDPHALPDIEIFYLKAGEMELGDEGEANEAGWYYWYCLPGCLPDGDAMGPYASEAEALAAAQEEAAG